MEAELLKRLNSKKRNSHRKALAPAKDRYEAYLEEVEAARARTMQEMSRLISMGLDLLDIYKFRTATHHMFTYILMDWLALVLVRPTRIETRIAADDCSPVALIRELDRLLPDIRR